MVVHTCILSYLGGRDSRVVVQGHPEEKFVETLSQKNKLCVVAHFGGGGRRRIMGFLLLILPEKKKKFWGYGSSCSKCEALNSKSRATKNKKRS
jgi:hypothetical protein